MRVNNMYINLQDAVALSSSTSIKALTVVPTTNGSRTRFGAELWQSIDEPERVEVLQLNENVVILPACTSNAGIKVGKGRYLYDTDLAANIVKLAGIDPTTPTKSRQIGTFEVQPVDDNINAAVINFDKSE